MASVLNLTFSHDNKWNGIRTGFKYNYAKYSRKFIKLQVFLRVCIFMKISSFLLSILFTFYSMHTNKVRKYREKNHINIDTTYKIQLIRFKFIDAIWFSRCWYYLVYIQYDRQFSVFSIKYILSSASNTYWKKEHSNVNKCGNTIDNLCMLLSWFQSIAYNVYMNLNKNEMQQKFAIKN